MNFSLHTKTLSVGILIASQIGCVTSLVDSRLERGVLDREAQLRQFIVQIDNQPKEHIDWNAANQRMMSHNLGIRQSERLLEDAEKATARQWLSLIPRTSAFLNISQDITSLTNLRSDDLNTSVVASFNIPNPFDFYGSLYAVALQKCNARWSVELDRRRAYTELYSAFLDSEMLDAEEELLASKIKSLSVTASSNPDSVLGQVQIQKRSLERRRLQHRSNVNRLLNTPGKNWDLSGQLPIVCYKNRYQKMNVGENFGRMALNLYAVRIEGAIMETQRVKFRQWPIINFGLSGPPLYSSSTESNFSANEFNMFSGVSQTLDLTDIGGRKNIQDANYRLAFTREQIRQNMESEAGRINQIRNTYRELIHEERHLTARQKRLGAYTGNNVEAILDDLNTYFEIQNRLIQLRRQIKQLDLQYVIWDERHWKN